jgi:hypothetical protein
MATVCPKHDVIEPCWCCTLDSKKSVQEQIHDAQLEDDLKHNRRPQIVDDVETQIHNHVFVVATGGK